MPSLMIVNPKRRKRKASPKRRTRKVATVTVKANPVRRRRKSATRAVPVARRARRSAKTTYRRIRRSVSSGRTGNFLAPLMGAVPGAVGAVAVNLIMSKLPLPAMLTTGPVKHVARVGVILGLGFLANKATRNPMVGQAIQGALTVSVYESIKELMAGVGMPLGEEMGMGQDNDLSYYSPASTIDGYIDNPAMGDYIDNAGYADDGLSRYVSENEFAEAGDEF